MKSVYQAPSVHGQLIMQHLVQAFFPMRKQPFDSVCRIKVATDDVFVQQGSCEACREQRFRFA